MLITEKKGSLSGGVNQQAPEHRISSQVEEMINCVPTLDRGLVKRNPTKNLPIKYLNNSPAQLSFDNNMWSYEFDKGASDVASAQFSVSITEADGLQILNTNTGTLYNSVNGINFVGNAENYLTSIFAGRTGYAATAIKDTIFIVNKTVTPAMLSTVETHPYKTRGYIWVKRIDPLDGYNYGCSIYLTLNGVEQPVINVALGAAQLTSQAAATDLATRIDAASVNLTATSNGSLVEITSINSYQISSVNASDSFGNSASFGWGYNVEVVSDLPKNMGSYTPLVKVGTNDRDSYWLLYKSGAWKEHYEIGIKTQLNGDTMPHIIKQKLNVVSGFIEFYVEAYTWGTRKIGDDTTNKTPQFVINSQPIKDIWFFRNRMGLITSSGFSVSEGGEYGNFFRTSVAALLDNDRIDAGVESRTAVNLEYGVIFDDSVVFFSNQSQFRFESGDILSPNSYKVTEILQNEVDLTIRPIAVNDKIFFISKRGDYSAVNEMYISNSSTRSSEAVDITAHCQSYIDGDLDRLTSSPINNMLFISSRVNRDTAFVYKWYDQANTRRQSAWFKWTFNGDLFATFALGKKFHIMIDRIGTIVGGDWIIGTGEWRMDEVWKMASPWIMSPNSIESLPQFESLAIFPQDHTLTFLDNDTTVISSFVDFGEWVAGQDGNKEIRGSLEFKTIQIAAEDNSEFGLWIYDKKRASTREVPSRLVKDRKPAIYSDAKNIKTGIIAEDETGFRINTVSFEGNMNLRARSR